MIRECCFWVLDLSFSGNRYSCRLRFEALVFSQFLILILETILYNVDKDISHGVKCDNVLNLLYAASVVQATKSSDILPSFSVLQWQTNHTANEKVDDVPRAVNM